MLASLLSKPSYCLRPPFIPLKTRKTAAQAAGCRYDRKAGVYLKSWASSHNFELKDHPWIKYKGPDGTVKYCSPDYLLIGKFSEDLLLIEVKIKHTRTAFPQLHNYKKIISCIHPNKRICLIELCCYFDALEYKVPLLQNIAPHPFREAAVMWDPRYSELN